MLGATVSIEESRTHVTVTGRFLGDPNLGAGRVVLYARERDSDSDDAVAEILDAPYVLYETTVVHTDSLIVFQAPEIGDITGGERYCTRTRTCLEHGDTPIAFYVGGVETAVSKEHGREFGAKSDRIFYGSLTFRYYTVGNLSPLDAPRTFISSCLSYESLTIDGFGFLTETEYFASGFNITDIDYQTRQAPPETTLLLADRDGEENYPEYLAVGYKRLNCTVQSTILVTCLMTPGYVGPPRPEGTIIIKPALSMNHGHTWAPTVKYFIRDDYFEDNEFFYWTLPQLDTIEDLTGPRSGNTSVRVTGTYFSGVGRFYALFDERSIECDISSDELAVCTSPAVEDLSAIVGGDKGGIKVNLRITLDFRSLQRRTCLESNNVTFYYHPHFFDVNGPFPALVPQSGLVTQTMVVDATSFLSDGKYGGSLEARDFDYSGAITVDNGPETVNATREDHRILNVPLSAGEIILTGESRIVEVDFNTKAEILREVMQGNCEDVSFWDGDYVTELFYWLEPFTCNTSEARVRKR